MIEEVKFMDVKPFASIVKKERVTMENPVNAHWYAVRRDGKIVSFCCLVLNKTARFKSNYTVKEYRRNGYLNELILNAKKVCRENGITKMTAFCTPLSVNQHIRNGAKLISKKGDISFVAYEVV